jgi:hypothetical protein
MPPVSAKHARAAGADQEKLPMRWIVALRRLAYARRWRQRHPGQPVPGEVLYYLHIGKTGGSFIKRVVKDPTSFVVEPQLLVPFGHNIRHEHLPAGSRFILGTRDPLTRFVSGFHSRRRRMGERGRQRLKRAERAAFARFATPNDLAEALSAADPAARAAAEAAMRAVRHVNEPHEWWFADRARLEADIRAGRVDRVRQEHLNAELRAVLEAHGFVLAPGKLEDRPRVHINPDGDGPALSPLAEANLRRHYAADYAFLDWLDGLGLTGGAGAAQPRSAASAAARSSAPS